ncbi:hypothetical protein [Rubrimonas cliftonensis]|uniref:Uncharacterized protein n=1 Tax=Rubrimonas cliftonensis TaxID=89524 RepID=A0A1H4EDC1_9RHOB|nr:hypothetical protein [Rubrimonas cliftonensis]SEA82580.1 hypothetical protein SAMN05444370_11333 [Rubrimonas cliftonensis]
MRVALIIALGLLAGPAAAQTAREAAEANIGVAMQLCVTNYLTPERMLPAFHAAGFDYRPEDWGGGEVHHWFAVPGGDVSAMVSPEERFCAISSQTIGVGEALPLARAALGRLFTGQIAEGTPEGRNIRPSDPEGRNAECSGYHFLAPQRLIAVSVGNAGNDPLCVEDGTSQIILRM